MGRCVFCAWRVSHENNCRARWHRDRPPAHGHHKCACVCSWACVWWWGPPSLFLGGWGSFWWRCSFLNQQDPYSLMASQPCSPRPLLQPRRQCGPSLPESSRWGRPRQEATVERREQGQEVRCPSHGLHPQAEQWPLLPAPRHDCGAQGQGSSFYLS